MRPELRAVRREALLDRLVALLTAEGFAAFTLDEIAARLRCSKTTLYGVADSRQELVVAVVKRYFALAVPVVEARVAAETDPAARVSAYLRAVGEYLAPASREFVRDLAEFAPAAAVYRRNTEAAADRIRQLISDGIEAGAFRSVHAGIVAEMVAATMFEIQRGELLRRLDVTDSAAYAELADLVVHALT